MKTTEEMTVDSTEDIIHIDRSKQIRCTNILTHGRRKGQVCNRMFCVGDIGVGGAIEHLCPRCKQLSRIMKIP